jgi:F0F1-type ATP synthase delta subunit
MLIAALILLQVVIFLGLILMFRKIMTQNVVLATRHLDELNQDFLKREDEINRQREEIRQKSESLLTKAQQEAAQLKAQGMKEAEGERERILKMARFQSAEIIQQAEKSRQLLISEIEERISREAINKACELIQNTLPEQFKQEVHALWVEDLIENGFQQVKRLRIPEDVQEIKLTSAFGLTKDQRAVVSKKLREISGREIALAEEIDPKVVVGLVITIGSLVLDGSLRNKIQEQAKSAKP